MNTNDIREAAHAWMKHHDDTTANTLYQYGSDE